MLAYNMILEIWHAEKVWQHQHINIGNISAKRIIKLVLSSLFFFTSWCLFSLDLCRLVFGHLLVFSLLFSIQVFSLLEHLVFFFRCEFLAFHILYNIFFIVQLLFLVHHEWSTLLFLCLYWSHYSSKNFKNKFWYIILNYGMQLWKTVITPSIL